MANTSAWTEEDRQLALGEDPAFPACHYRRGCLLGQGGYARVYKVLDVWKGTVYAGKSSPDAVKHLRKEAKILRNLSHVRSGSAAKPLSSWSALWLTTRIKSAQYCQVHRIL